MTDDVLIVLGFTLLLPSPGLTGYAVAVWRARASHGGGRAWIAWSIPTGAWVAFWAACWGYSLWLRHDTGSDDGSVAMASTCLVASVVVNAFAGLLLVAWHRRRKASMRGIEAS